MEKEEVKNVKMKVLNRLTNITYKYSTLKVIRGGILKNYEFKTNNEVRKKQNRVNSNEANNSMFEPEVLKKYGIEKNQNGEYILVNQQEELINGKDIETR